MKTVSLTKALDNLCDVHKTNYGVWLFSTSATVTTEELAATIKFYDKAETKFKELDFRNAIVAHGIYILLDTRAQVNWFVDNAPEFIQVVTARI